MTGLMALAGLPVMGAWVDRAGAYRVFLTACAFQIARMFITANISDTNWLWMPHLLHFVAWPGREIGTVVLLSSLAPSGIRGRVFAILASVRMSGMMVGSFLMGQLIETFGYREMYLAMGFMATPGLLVFLLVYRQRRNGSAGQFD